MLANWHQWGLAALSGINEGLGLLVGFVVLFVYSQKKGPQSGTFTKCPDEEECLHCCCTPCVHVPLCTSLLRGSALAGQGFALLISAGDLLGLWSHPSRYRQVESFFR